MGGRAEGRACPSALAEILEYKKAMLEDIWNADVTINNEANDLNLNVSNWLKLTLKKKIKIVETWEFTNPKFVSLSISEKLTQFQNMWKPDENSFTFFSSVHHHLRRNSTQCDHFCTQFTSPCCSNLTYYLATNDWPDWSRHPSLSSKKSLKSVVKIFPFSYLRVFPWHYCNFAIGKS